MISLVYMSNVQYLKISRFVKDCFGVATPGTELISLYCGRMPAFTPPMEATLPEFSGYPHEIDFSRNCYMFVFLFILIGQM